jgi:predicted DNA-binding transcriptional regulator YafY
MREGLRSFAVDAIREATISEARAKEVPAAELDEYVTKGYGIFAGREVQWAKLRFTPRAARWVSAQQWHPDERRQVEKDGSYVLDVPYADHRELLMEVLKFGADVEVLEPRALRKQAAEALRSAAARYS